MTTTDRGAARRRRRTARRCPRVRSRQVFDRPLTSYYLLLGAVDAAADPRADRWCSAPPACAPTSYDGNSYHVVPQAADLGPARAAHRLRGLPACRTACCAGSPGRHCSPPPVLLALTQYLAGFAVNGNQNWLALGPLQIQPSEMAKLAMVLWSAHIYARKERLLGDWRHTLFPVVPVIGAGHRAGRDAGRPRHRAGADGHHLGHALGGRRAGAAVRRLAPERRRARALPGHHECRADAAADQLRRPVQGLPGRRLAAGARLVRDVERRAVRQGHRRPASRSGAACPRRTPTSSSRSSARSSGWSARCWCWDCS